MLLHIFFIFSQNADMLIFIFRVLIVYIIVLLYLRIMGKRQLGEMQPFELVITLIIADIATLPMTQTSMPLLFSLIPLTSIVVLHYLVSFLVRKSIVARRIINGKPVIVISPSGVDYEKMQELNMNFDDLMQSLRQCNYYKIEDVQYAIMETNGTLSVIPKSHCSPLTTGDANIKLPETSLPLNIITSGKILNENIKLAGIDKEFINEILKKANLKSIKEVLLFTLDGNGKVIIQPYNQEFKEIKTNYRAGGKW